MTRAKNVLFESMTCLYSIPFTCKKKSALCLGTFPFNGHLEMHLQKGSVLCICRSAYNLFVVCGLGVVLGVSVTSSVTQFDWGCGVGSSVVLC